MFTEPLAQMNPCSPPDDVPDVSRPDDPELTELREAVHDAGRRLRTIADAPLALVWADVASGGCLVGVLLGLVTYVFISLPARALYAFALNRRFRRRVARLSPDQRPEAVRILKRERGGEADAFVERLIRQLQAPTELAPAGAPGGRGDEPSPAEKA